MNNYRGFTLLELMIVVMVLGIVASLGLASYSNYIETTRAQSLNSNFEAAVSTARNNYRAAENLSALGAPVARVIPTDSAGWVDLMNAFPSSAPAGGVAYEAGTGNTTNGAVGLVFAGDYSNNSSTLTVHRPAFSGMAATSAMITQADI